MSTIRERRSDVYFSRLSETGISVDLGAAQANPPKNREKPMHFSVFTTFLPQKLCFSSNIFDKSRPVETGKILELRQIAVDFYLGFLDVTKTLQSRVFIIRLRNVHVKACTNYNRGQLLLLQDTNSLIITTCTKMHRLEYEHSEQPCMT